MRARVVSLAFVVVCLSWVDAGAEGRPSANADAVVSKADLAADLRQLIALLETAHPDPYQAAGGRLAFHRKGHQIKASIPPSGLTASAFLRLVRPLVAAVEDGHTRIGPPSSAKGSKRLWIELSAASQQLFVRGVYAAVDRGAIGARLLSVDGVAFQELARRQRATQGFDNEYNNLAHLVSTLNSPQGLAELLDVPIPPTQLRLEVELPDGSTRALIVPLSTAAPSPLITAASKVELPPANAADLGWGFLDARRQIAYLRVDSAMRYREAFEVWRAMGFTANLGSHLLEVATAATDGEPPSTVDARIAAVPSATEIFGQLFEAMRSSGATTLVVDLRENAGGNSAIAGILSYFLYGEEGLRASGNAYQISRLSALFFDNNSALDPTAYLAKRGLALGEYDFGQEDAWLRPSGDPGRAVGVSLEDYSVLPTFYRAAKSKRITPFVPQQLVVLTGFKTYSAGYAIAALLYKRGATVVGVPSAQAGNCFIDGLQFKLDHSGLRGSISSKRSVAFPGDPRIGALLSPKIELSYARWAAMSFDPNAAVTLALEAIRDGDLRRP